jgi:hypothetical protein
MFGGRLLLCALIGSMLLAAGAAPAAAQTARPPSCSPSPTYNPAVPTPQDVLGFPLGVGQPRDVTTEEIRRYLHAVDEASPRVTLGTMATSVRGQPIEYAIVSSDGNQSRGRLDLIARSIRSLRDPRVLPEFAARLIAKATPAIVWMAGNVHGGETSGADAELKVLYELAARTDCQVRDLNSRLVTIIVPTQNPDGRDANRRQNEYGFDLNRDWFARTQVETDPKVELLRRYPGQVFIDAHQRGGRQYFFPPNDDPVHHEITDSSLRWIDEIGAANRAAFGHAGACPPGDQQKPVPEQVPECYFSYQTYDLFAMEYGDTVPSAGFGAAGMTYEKGNASPTELRVDQQFRTHWAALRWAGDNRERLLREWYDEWRKAIAQGAQGELEPNQVVAPGHEVEFPVPDTRIRSYFLLGNRQVADVRKLVQRLRRMDVDVYRLVAPFTVPNARIFGGRSARHLRVPAGAYWIPLDQPQKHWIQATLGEDPYAPLNAFYDIATWSNPLLTGIDAASTGDAVRPLALPVHAAGGGIRGYAPGRGSYSYVLDSSQAAALTFQLLGQGVPLSRDPATNRVSLPASAAPPTLPGLARELGVDVNGSPHGPAGAPLRLPRLGVFAGTGVSTTAGSYGEIRWVVEQRWKASAASVTTADIEGNAPAFRDLDVLVVPDGSTSGPDPIGGLTANGLANLRAWVEARGTYVGVRNLGTRLARAALLTSAAERAKPTDAPLYQVRGSHFRVDVSAESALGLGRPREDMVYNNNDPILEPSTTGSNVFTYPADDRFWHNGYTQREDTLKGSAALVDEPVGDGHAVLFAFNPLFRAWSESGEQLLANAILAPAPDAAPDVASADGREAAREALAAQPEPSVHDSLSGPIVINVAEDDAEKADAIARRYTEAAELERGADAASLVIPNRRGLAADEHPFARELVQALEAAGVELRSVAL